MADKRIADVLTPVFVTGMGRSGSTLAMQLLGTDPRCIFDQVYPLESRYLSLITHFAAQWRGWTFADYGQTASAYQSILGTNPVVLRNTAETDKLISIPDSEDVLLALWKQFSAAARESAPEARFYGEKVVEWMPSFLAPYLDCYALYLFRDPRDLFLSANSFNSKRGYLAFGRTEADSDRDHALTLAYRYLHRFESYRAFKASGGKTSLVRYEDLVLNPLPALSELIEATGMRICPLQDDDSFSQHRTSDSAEQSVKRWKREPVKQEVLEIFDEVLHDVLIELGYETADRSPDGFNFDFKDEQLKSRIAAVENGEIAGFTPQGMLVNAKAQDVSITLNVNGIATESVSEIWTCFSGDFGGSSTIEWSGGSSAFTASESADFTKTYDPGRHCTTLRYTFQNEKNWSGNLTGLRIKFSNKGCHKDAQQLIFRAVKLISKSKKSEETVTADTTGATNKSKASGGFLNQLLGASKKQ